MNRRDFFKAVPAVAVSPVIPTAKESNLLIGEITIWNGKEHIKIGNAVNERDLKEI